MSVYSNNIIFKVHQILPFCFIAYPSPLFEVLCCEPIPTILTIRSSHTLYPKSKKVELNKPHLNHCIKMSIVYLISISACFSTKHSLSLVQYHLIMQVDTSSISFPYN